MIIDSHQHFWQLSRGDYSWLTPKLKTLYRDFSPQDLQPYLAKSGVDGTILVQAAATVEETQFLFGIAEKNEFVKGVVGWVNMEAENAPALLRHLAQNQYLVGIRPMLQDIADTDWMLTHCLTPAYETLIELNLTFDALIQPRHLKNLKILVERYPSLKVVIDHAAKPSINTHEFEPWASQLISLKENHQVYCKLSGLVTEAGEDWSYDDLKPYMDHLLCCFGEQRILWGSDWPILTLNATYAEWYTLCKNYISQYFSTGLESIFAGNSMKVYEFKSAN
jgi:L-fucono-1,5-lactonase